MTYYCDVFFYASSYFNTNFSFLNRLFTNQIHNTNWFIYVEKPKKLFSAHINFRPSFKKLNCINLLMLSIYFPVINQTLKESLSTILITSSHKSTWEYHDKTHLLFLTLISCFILKSFYVEMFQKKCFISFNYILFFSNKSISFFFQSSWKLKSSFVCFIQHKFIQWMFKKNSA